MSADGDGEVLQQLLTQAIRKNGQARVNRYLLPLTFPGGAIEIELFCAVHGFHLTRDGQDLVIMDVAPPLVVAASLDKS
jgi:hypothetical protein